MGNNRHSPSALRWRWESLIYNTKKYSETQITLQFKLISYFFLSTFCMDALWWPPSHPFHMTPPKVRLHDLKGYFQREPIVSGVCQCKTIGSPVTGSPVWLGVTVGWGRGCVMTPLLKGESMVTLSRHSPERGVTIRPHHGTVGSQVPEWRPLLLRFPTQKPDRKGCTWRTRHWLWGGWCWLYECGSYNISTHTVCTVLCIMLDDMDILAAAQACISFIIIFSNGKAEFSVWVTLNK